MLRHVLLAAVAPPLVWLTASIFPQPRWLSLRSPLGPLVTHPMTAWLAGTVAVIGWHVPAAFDLAERSASWHGMQEASFFLTGLLFWLPVVRPWPAIARLSRVVVPLYLFAATLPCDALSAFLVFCDRVVYAQHPGEHCLFSMSPLVDQQTAGAFMWVSITFLYMAPALVMTVRILSPAPQRRRSTTAQHRLGSLHRVVRE